MAQRNRQISNTYHTAGRLRCFCLTPQLVPPSLDVVHSVEDHNAVPLEHALGSRISDTARFFFCARMVIYYAWVGGIMRGDNVDLVPGLQ
jgi:hypothetical protein